VVRYREGKGNQHVDNDFWSEPAEELSGEEEKGKGICHKSLGPEIKQDIKAKGAVA